MAVLLRIADWYIYFECNRTRDLKAMRWAPVPNKLDGDGYTELMEHKNGASHYGAWIVLVHIASKCDPRGTLMRDAGIPHDAATLSRIARIPVRVFEEAIPEFIRIG